MEATEVLTEQSGLTDFAPDGGYQIYELLEIAESADEIQW